MKVRVKVIIIFGFLLLLATFFILRSKETQAQNPPVQNPPVQNPPVQLGGVNSRAIKYDCAGCHGPNAKLPSLPPGEQFHKSAHREFSASVHSKIQPNGKPAADCKDCHTLKGDMTTDFPPDDPRSTVFATNQEQTCGACHEKALKTFHNSIHGRLLDKGDTRAASCSDCHGRHTIQAVKDLSAKVNRSHLLETCLKCHSGIVPAYEQSSHGIAFKQGSDKAPVCIDCHSAISHNEAPLTTRDFSMLMVNKCSGCHQQQAPSYRDTFHGQATKTGYKLAATCADCHTPHKNLPSSDPASSVHKTNLVQTCAACHTNANPSFATFNPHPQPNNPEKGYATYIIYNLLWWLLFGIFGFFALHTLLWLQRSVVATIRKENPQPVADENEQWVERFSKPHRLTHLLIIISFLGLAATGLPLMYSFTEWGSRLVRMEGGLAVTRFLHRSFALMTFCYIIYHLWFIVKTTAGKGDWSILGGPNSMVIRKQDFVDLYNMLRWLLYLGPRPQSDRFSYWEKFDYYAVFLGIPVIALSGLLLWFPTFFTRILPGEILNVAMIVHSETTLLATGFIFAFHFFHNHLRPEKFPMDIAMFTGKIPVSRLKAEHPLEYERLAAEGKLDSIVVEPPSPRARLIAAIFGFAAYFIGMFLIFAIFITLLTVN